MKNEVTLEDCYKCPHHASYRDGFVMCRYWIREEQRMTQIINSTTSLINCPKSEDEERSA